MLAFICIRGLEEPCWTERQRRVCSTFFRHKREYSSASQREREFVLSRSEVGPAIWTESNFFWVCSNILWSECWWLKSLFYSFVPFLSFDQFCWMRSLSSKLSLSLISARDFCNHLFACRSHHLIWLLVLTYLWRIFYNLSSQLQVIVRPTHSTPPLCASH